MVIYFTVPVKNAKKKFKNGGIYHVYNRGVNKKEIFLHDDDYSYFLHLLQKYVSRPSKNDITLVKNYHTRVDILAFCLMENHFHLIIRQNRKRVLSEFMKSLGISYTLYINKKYQRVGHLFQGIYKARLIGDSNDLINISRYVHLNPEKNSEDPISYPYSSINAYLNESDKFSFIKTDEILSIYTRKNVAVKMYNDYLFKGSDLGSDPI